MRRAAASRVCGVVASAVLYGLAFPPLAWRWLAWVALVPLLLALRRATLREALGLAFVWGVVDALVVGACLTTAVESYYQQPAWLGWTFLLLTGLATAVPYYTLFGGAYWLLVRRGGIALPLLTAAAWVAVEYGRVALPPGNPWALVGYSQVGALALMQIGAWTGVHGMTFAVVLVNASLAEAVVALRRPTARRAAFVGLAGALGLAAAIVLYGRARLAATPTADSSGTSVAIAQANVSLGRVWRRTFYGRNLDLYMELTHEAVRRAPAEVVFWPESAMSFYLLDEPAYRSSLAQLLSVENLELVAGGPRVEARDNGRSVNLNSVFVVDPDGSVRDFYDKEVLLPFAESFPLSSATLVRRRFSVAQELVPGKPRGEALPTRAGRAGVLVCNEAFFPELARKRVAEGADYLLNPANDSWFDGLQYAEQAFDIVRMRAVEQGRPLVRASTSGPSAIVDAFGRIVARSPALARSVVHGRLDERKVTTPYHVWGDAFALSCVLLALCGVFRPARLRRR